MKHHIRWLIRRNMTDVLEADNGGFGEERIHQCLLKRNCIGMVIEVGEEVVGFMLYELRKNTIQLLRLCVARKGYRGSLDETLEE